MFLVVICLVHFVENPQELCQTMNMFQISVLLRYIRHSPHYSSFCGTHWVISERELDLFKSCVDLWMITNPTGRERTRADWVALLAKVGLKIVEVHQKGADNVIEVDLV